jgi:hypothetical protein
MAFRESPFSVLITMQGLRVKDGLLPKVADTPLPPHLAALRPGG